MNTEVKIQKQIYNSIIMISSSFDAIYDSINLEYTLVDCVDSEVFIRTGWYLIRLRSFIDQIKCV